MGIATAPEWTSNMSPSKRRRKALHPPQQLERLEQRLPLAGNVTAEFTGSTLRLTGDNLANDVVVASAAGGRIAVIGIATTINGGPAAFVTSGPVTTIVANLNGGDDAVGFGNKAADYAGQRQFTMLATGPSSAWFGEQEPPIPFDVVALQARIDEVVGGVTKFSIPGSLTVTTGDGNDSVGIGGDLGGSVVVNLGSADFGNGIVIGSEASASRVGGGVTVKGGDSIDLFAIGNVSVAGTVSAALGDGMNFMVVGGEADAPANIGAFSYTGGAGIDIVGLIGDVTVRNDVRVSTGVRGEDSVGVHESDAGSTVKVRGNVLVNTGSDGDTVSLVGEVWGNVSVTTGGGPDAVSVSSAIGWVSSDGGDPLPTFEVAGPSSIGRSLTVSTGAGRDVISIAASTVGRDCTIDAGAGNDRVRIADMQVRRNLFVRLGAGDDALEITNLRALAAYLNGGYGTNSMTTRAGKERRSLSGA
jgi:hypothetical protein